MNRVHIVMTFPALLMALLFIGCNAKSAPSHSPESTPAIAQTTYPPRPTTPTPLFRVFNHHEAKFILVTKPDATDADIEAIIWQLRDASQNNTLGQLSAKPNSIPSGTAKAWFHIYRGPKCATETYADGPPPCGASVHVAGDFSFDNTLPQHWLNGILYTPSGQEQPLWNSSNP